MATDHDLEPGIYRGDPFDHVIAFGKPGDWTDLDGFTFEAKIRRTTTSEVLATLDVQTPTGDVDIEWTDGTTVTVPQASHIVLHLDAADTRLEPDSVRWDLQQTAPTVVTLLKGTIPVDGDITR